MWRRSPDALVEKNEQEKIKGTIVEKGAVVG